MNSKIKIMLLAFVFLISINPLRAQTAIGLWEMNEGSGTQSYNRSPGSSNWGMIINGSSALWGYWQPGAYAFANEGYAATAVTSASAWTSRENLTLTASFNVTGNVHDSGSVFAGGGIFGAGYLLSSGGNAAGYNAGAFYVNLDTANPAAPTIGFRLDSVGFYSEALPVSVVDPSINGKWNSISYEMVNNVSADSLSIQLLLNGVDLGAAIDISGYYMEDFTSYANYAGTEFEIGANAGGGYQPFEGFLEDVSLVATATPEPYAALLEGPCCCFAVGSRALIFN